MTNELKGNKLTYLKLIFGDSPVTSYEHQESFYKNIYFMHKIKSYLLSCWNLKCEQNKQITKQLNVSSFCCKNNNSMWHVLTT